MREVRRLAGALFAVALFAGSAALAALPAAAAPQAQATVTVTTPATRFFELGTAMALVDNGQAQGFPEVQADHGGGIVVSYLEGFWSYYGSPTYTRFNATTGEAVSGPFDLGTGIQWDMWGNTTARGDYAALDSQDRFLRAAWGYSIPNSSVYVKGMDLAGGIQLTQRTVGQTPYQRSAVAMAVGANDTIHFIHYDTAVRYSVMASNGTWLFRNATIAAGTSTKFAPQLVFDAPAGRMIASWSLSGGQGGVVAALAPNGSVAWTQAIAMTGANLSISATQDGGILAVYADSGAISAIKYDRNGTQVGPGKTIVASSPSGRSPRPMMLGADEMFVVWSDVSDGADLDVRAMALNATDLSVTIAPTLISNDATSSVNPRAVVDRDGGIWVVWQNDTSTYTATIWGSRVFPRSTGYSMEVPSTAVSGVRGEITRVPLHLTNLVPVPGEYNFSFSIYPLSGGPSNWSGWVETTGGSVLPGVTLPPGGAMDLVLAIEAPVVDPAGYGAFVTLLAADLHRVESPLALPLNVTVTAGHRFDVLPADQNVTAMPGQAATVTFQVRNIGTVAQSGMPLVLSAPPPSANWTASLAPATLTAAPGATVSVVLSVTPPSAARSGESYCARLRVQHPNDAFSLATAGFCVRVALIADPQVTPPSLSVEVDPGVAMPMAWTLTNVGNAGAGIVCSLAVQEVLPLGWSLTGSPGVARLVGGASAALSLGITAPPQAIGGTKLDLTVRAACDGSAVFHDLPLTVTVRSLHVVNYRTAGTVGDASAFGSAVFTVNVENNGNVPEQVSATVDEAPSGWAATASLTQGGLPATQVDPFSTGLLRLDVQAPGNATAGAYQVVMAFRAGDQPSSAIAFTVRLSKSFGITALFLGSPLAVEASGVVHIVGDLMHHGNAPDTFTVRVEADGTQFWSSEIAYTPTHAQDASTLVGTSLTLDAFSEGTLTINVTAPREPVAGTVTLRVVLSNVHGETVGFTMEVRLLIPDLQLRFAEGQSLGPGSTVAPGTTSVRVNVSNPGNLAAAAFDVRLTLDGAAVGVQTIALLEAGESRELTFAFNITGGEHRLSAEVDPRDGANVSRVHGKVYETDEANNLASATLSAGAPPPAPQPPKSLSTTAQASLVWVIAALAAAGMVGFVVLRLRMRRSQK